MIGLLLLGAGWLGGYAWGYHAGERDRQDRDSETPLSPDIPRPTFLSPGVTLFDHVNGRVYRETGNTTA